MPLEQYHQQYLEAMRAESQRLIETINQQTNKFLADYSMQQAQNAATIILQELAKIPEKAAKDIKDAQETFGPSGFDSPELLDKKIGFIRKEIDRDIKFICHNYGSIIDMAETNGADVSQLRKLINEYEKFVRIELEKLF